MGSQQAIRIFPSERTLLRNLCVNVAILLGALALAYFAATRTYDNTGPSSAAFQQLLAAATLVLAVPIVIPATMLYIATIVSRLLWPRPTLTIAAEGIVDGCSLVPCGLGLIRWADIAAVYPSRFANQPYTRGPKNTYLVIRPVAADVVLRGRNPIVRLLRRLVTLSYRDPLDVFIPAFMLSVPVAEVASTVREVYEARRAHDRTLRALPPIRIAEALPERAG